MVSLDFFVVPTITFQLLFTFVILSHDRRRLMHFAATANPTAEWTARQLLEAFPWDHALQYLLRDRDRAYGLEFSEMAKWMGIQEVLTAPQSPWQHAYLERLIGSIRRQCLDHVIVKEGQTDFLVDNVTEAVRALGRISEIDRRACRSRVRQYFSIDTMVEAYERVYSTIFDLEAKRQS